MDSGHRFDRRITLQSTKCLDSDGTTFRRNGMTGAFTNARSNNYETSCLAPSYRARSGAQYISVHADFACRNSAAFSARRCAVAHSDTIFAHFVFRRRSRWRGPQPLSSERKCRGCSARSWPTARLHCTQRYTGNGDRLQFRNKWPIRHCGKSNRHQLAGLCFVGCTGNARCNGCGTRTTTPASAPAPGRFRCSSSTATTVRRPARATAAPSDCRQSPCGSAASGKCFCSRRSR